MFTFRDGAKVSRLGFGAMRLTGQPGNFGPYADWDQGVALLRRVRDLGVNHIDTARAYGPLDNERLVAEAFAGQEDGIFIATKGGLEKTRIGGEMTVTRAGAPKVLAGHISESQAALASLPISLFYLHFPDPNVPLERSVEALAEARDTGQIGRIGLSNVTVDQLRRAQTVAQIDAVQNRFSLALEDRAEGEALLAACAQDGIAFVPHGPLGAHPMKQGAALPIGEAMEWLLGLSPNVLLIPGTTSVQHLEENVAAFKAMTEDDA